MVLYDFFAIGSGIEHTIGGLIVICSTALLFCAGALVAFVPAMPPWLMVLLNVGIVADIVGSGVAGYFLETNVVIALLGVALLAWIALLVTRPRATSAPNAAGVPT
ncbi:MAG: hypothetical protein ACREDL_08335 [Bradyrhizobium sp.]